MERGRKKKKRKNEREYEREQCTAFQGQYITIPKGRHGGIVSIHFHLFSLEKNP